MAALFALPVPCSEKTTRRPSADAGQGRRRAGSLSIKGLVFGNNIITVTAASSVGFGIENSEKEEDAGHGRRPF